MKKYRNYIVIALVIIALIIIYSWYQSPLSTEYKEVYWIGPSGAVTFENCKVDTFRNGDIIATISTAESIPVTSLGEFTQLKWNEASKIWEPIYN